MKRIKEGFERKREKERVSIVRSHKSKRPAVIVVIRSWRPGMLLLALTAGLLLAGCAKSGTGDNAKGEKAGAESKKVERKVLFWYDPMNPTVHFDHPGKSPFMDMDLQPMYADQNATNPDVISVDPVMVQNIGVVTAAVERRNLTRTINTYGVVMPDEKSITDINTRVGGWIDRLYFDYTGMEVKKGQPMAVIYSPELIAAEQEFLQSVSFAEVSGNSLTKPGNLIQSARERLRFFGMSDREIDDLQATGKVLDRVVIHSTGDGVILDKSVFEGQKISVGQTLFRVADLRHVWVLADVFKIDMPFLKLGSRATVAYSSSETFEGTADFIYPEVDATARSVKVRIPLNNPGMAMKVGQYVNVAIHSPISFDAIAVPSQAVINTGLRQVVAVALGGGKFEIREVKLGAYADGYYEVTDGLTVGETVVTSGQFLIDSDANLRSAGTAMAGMPGMATPSSSRTHGGTNEEGTMKKTPGMDTPAPRKTSGEEMSGMPGMKMEKKNTKKHETKKDTSDTKGMDTDMPGMDMPHDTTGGGQ
jgi:multidrug efflux pump subunit AcrA (membrane-fusion protein)